GT
ncbi:Ribonuclease HI, partial [Haemophilus influenzae]